MSDLIRMDGGNAVISAKTVDKIIGLQTAIQRLKEQEETLKQELLEAMKANGVLKIDSEELIVTYIAPTYRETLDSKALKAKQPDIYDAFIKMTPVKESIRIKVK